MTVRSLSLTTPRDTQVALGMKGESLSAGLSLLGLCKEFAPTPPQFCMRTSNWSWAFEDTGCQAGETACYSESASQNHSWGWGSENPAFPSCLQFQFREPRMGSLFLKSMASSPSSAVSRPSRELETVFEIVWAKPPMVCMGKLRPKGQGLSPGHRASRWQSWFQSGST